MPKLRIHAHENGPLVIAGSAAYRDGEGREQTTPGTAVALCRCGLSSNRPFCDGSHKEVGFHSEEILLHIQVP
jgi:CDGSH-type Zn-finger protein